jgi:hypothetical protein
MSAADKSSGDYSLSLLFFLGLTAVQFKLKPMFWSVALSLSLGATGMSFATEQVLPAQVELADLGPAFGIQELVLVGSPDLLSKKSKERLLNILSAAQGTQSNLRNVQAAVKQGQQFLDQLSQASYVLSIPAQTVVDGGKVAVQISPILQNVKIVVVPGFDEETVKASLPPMLQKGAIYTGAEWLTPQTLAMLNDHPLRSTTVKFRIEPDQPVSADVSVVAPLGESQTTVMIDSFGNSVIGRGMMTVSHVQGNVGVPNDVLTFYGATSLNKPFQVSLGSLRYVLPDVDALASHSFGLMHSESNVDTPFFSLGNISGKGSYNEISYRQSHYLNWGKSLGMSGSKFFADVALAKSQANTQYLSNVLMDYSLTTLPVTFGIEGVMNAQTNQSELLKDMSALVRLQTVFNKAGALGLSGTTDFDKARSGASSSKTLRWLVDGRATFLNQFRTNALFTGQYSGDKLLPTGQMAIAGDRISVRGFMDSVLMGDSAAVLRLEIEPLALNQAWDLTTSQPYAFYDVGYKRGGNDLRTLSVSSAGFGMRFRSQPQNMTESSLDIFIAHKLRGADLDLLSGTNQQVDRNTLWAIGAYRF